VPAVPLRLVVIVPDGRFVIEMTPVPDRRGQQRGVVAGGAVGSRWLGRFRLFQYEVRRWDKVCSASASGSSGCPT
jgi:hypothetical protein